MEPFCFTVDDFDVDWLDRRAAGRAWRAASGADLTYRESRRAATGSKSYDLGSTTR